MLSVCGGRTPLPAGGLFEVHKHWTEDESAGRRTCSEKQRAVGQLAPRDDAVAGPERRAHHQRSVSSLSRLSDPDDPAADPRIPTSQNELGVVQHIEGT